MPIFNSLTESCVPALPGNNTGLTGTPGKWRPVILVFTALMVVSFSAKAQYLETFSTPNKGYLLNCTNDLTAVNWTLTPWDPTGTCQINPPNPITDLRDPLDYFSTTAAGALESIDLDQEVCWESPLINTTAAPTVSVKVNLSWVGFDTDIAVPSCAGDYIRVSYSVNGGPFVMVPNVAGGNSCATVAYLLGDPLVIPPGINGMFSINQTGIAGGSTLKIRICVSTNANAELVSIDNVNVPEAGVTVGCAAPVLSTVVTPVGCSNPNSGAITLNVSAGTPGYTYDWSNNGPNMPDIDPKDLSGLPVGMYTVTVTDAASCSATTSATVGNAPTLSLSTQVLGATCAGATDGEIGLTVSGGVPGYTYDWSNNGPNTPDIDPEDLIGVGTGTYTITVTDASGCTATTSAVVGILPAGAYLEQFNVANKGYLANFVDDFSAVNWTMSSWAPQPPAAFGRDLNDFFRTSGGVLVGDDFDQEVCWTSPQISRNGATQFSVDLSWTLFDNEDYINVKYSIDGGAYVTIPNAFGGGAGTIQYPPPTLDQSNNITVTQMGLSGSTIQIQVCGNMNSETITIDNVSVPGSAGVNCPVPTISLVPTNVTCSGGNNGSILVTASAGTPGYNVSWSGPSSGNPAGTEIAASGGTYNITTLTTGTYMVTVTGANGFFATASTTLTATNPTQNPAFAYAKSAFCRLGTDPLPTIYGVPGGMFSAPGAVSINASSGLIDLSASTVGGPYNITYTTPGPCAGSTTFAISIVNCAPGATLTDAITLDNGAPGKADPGDKITLTAKITNAQTADYEAVQMALNNDPRVTFVPGSFKSTPIAVDDAYTTTMNTMLTIVVGSGVLQNDFDDDILSVTAFSAMSAQGGAVLVNANGSFTYNPPVNFTGNDSFTYTITDSDLQTNVGTVRIRVQ